MEEVDVVSEPMLNELGKNPAGINPILAIQEEALRLAGMTHDQAFAIDISNITILVEQRIFLQLCDCFFRRLYGDVTHKYRKMFSPNMETNTKNLCDYLYRRCGGETKLGAKKFYDLAEKHQMFELDESMADWWLGHFGSALLDVRYDIREELRAQLYDFARYTCYMLIVSCRYRREQAKHSTLF